MTEPACAARAAGGLLVGPFILTAVLTGTLYVLTPQIESLIYREQLTATAVAAALG